MNNNNKKTSCSENKKKRLKISLEHSCQIRSAYQLAGYRGKQLLHLFPQYSKATIYRHAVKPINGDEIHDKRKNNKGRPTKLSSQDNRNIIRSIYKLRIQEGSFTSNRVQMESGVTNVCNKTVRRTMNKSGFRYLKSRKKGLLSLKDCRDRLRFCRNIRKDNLGQNFWNEKISFYLDGKGFEFKVNPLDQARAPSAREWRQSGEGLKMRCVAKGKKEGSRNANFMVAISHGKGVVLCEQYFGAITGEKFGEIVKRCFPDTFKTCEKSKIFLMDGCPRQNSKTAMEAIRKVGGEVFSIPPRSPDLNPIENFFNLAQKELTKEVKSKQITKQTFAQFSERVKKFLLNYPSKEIDKIIASMNKRIGLVIKGKGQRTKY